MEGLRYGLQGEEGVLYCLHGTQPYLVCSQCIVEGRERERHEMLRESFDRLSAVLERLEAKLGA